MSAGLPSGAPLSTHAWILASSSSVRALPFLNFWIPTPGSTKNGGMAPMRSLMAVRSLIRVAKRLVSWYVVRAMGAPPRARWQFWQLR